MGHDASRCVGANPADFKTRRASPTPLSTNAAVALATTSITASVVRGTAAAGSNGLLRSSWQSGHATTPQSLRASGKSAPSTRTMLEARQTWSHCIVNPNHATLTGVSNHATRDARECVYHSRAYLPGTETAPKRRDARQLPQTVCMCLDSCSRMQRMRVL